MATLLDKRLIIVTGKGGVGKSSTTAALALLLARKGRRTLFCELNTQGRVGSLLESASVGPDVTPVEANLWGVNIRSESALREYALMTLKFESIYNAVFENRFVRYFLRFLPSVHELVMLGKVIYHLDEKREDGTFKYEHVILDGPATGHAISFLRLPRVLVDTVPPGPLSRAAKHMRATLEDREATALVLVSVPEEMPINETLELCKTLRQRVEIFPQLVLLNSFVPPRFSAADLEALRAHPALLAWAREHEQLAMASAEFRQQLSRELKLTVLPLPRLYLQSFGRSAVETLANHLEVELQEA